MHVSCVSYRASVTNAFDFGICLLQKWGDLGMSSPAPQGGRPPRDSRSDWARPEEVWALPSRLRAPQGGGCRHRAAFGFSGV